MTVYVESVVKAHNAVLGIHFLAEVVFLCPMRSYRGIPIILTHDFLAVTGMAGVQFAQSSKGQLKCVQKVVYEAT
jgi:hypothetical protein